MLPKKSMNSPVDSCVKKYAFCQQNMAVYGETKSRLQSISCWSDPQVQAKRFWALDDFDPWWSRGWWFSDQNLRCPHVIDFDTQMTMTNWCPRVIGIWSNTSKFFKCPWSSNLVISSCSCCTWAHIPRFRTNIYCMCIYIYIYYIYNWLNHDVYGSNPH